MVNITKSKKIIILATVFTTASSIAMYSWYQENRPPVLEIYVFSLSGGRSMFIRTAEDKRILIDGGSNSEVIRKITEILPFYSHRIDMIIATNNEGKNVSGLIDMISRFHVEKVYIPKYTLESLGIAGSPDQIFSTLLDTVYREGIQSDELKRGDTIQLDSQTNLRVLFPESSEKFIYSKASPPEILFKIRFKNNSFAFFGNASPKIQKYIASTSDSLINNSDVLIISHSALPTNMAIQLINKLRPKYLIYSKTQTISAKTSKEKAIEDPLSSIPIQNRLNIKEKGRIKITSDGNQYTII